MMRASFVASVNTVKDLFNKLCEALFPSKTDAAARIVRVSPPIEQIERPSVRS